MLEDLFAAGSALPYVAAAPTMRWVRESMRPPDDLFVYQFFRWHRETVLRAVQAILGLPHRKLSDEEQFVRPHEVRQIELEGVLRMLQSGRGQGGVMEMSPLNRLRPDRVFQRIPVESFDSPENRFILSACWLMLEALERVERRRWFRKSPVTDLDRFRIAEVKRHLSVLVTDPRFAEISESFRMPAQSRVLQRRDGYRDLTLLWQQYLRARSPFFQHLQTAIDLRDVASMYEYWVLFELIARIKVIAGREPVLSQHVDEHGSPEFQFHASFVGLGTLHYNKTYYGYSGINLRPEYVWELPGGELIVMDAKFRLHKLTDLFIDEPSGDSMQTSKAKDDDLQKMHTYRDAIDRVTTAIVIYPGTVNRFRTSAGVSEDVGIQRIVEGLLDGVGAIAMQPAIEES
jgi:predicted component of viral defense system (DUF524 family)